MPLVYGIGGLVNVPAGSLSGFGPPSRSLKGSLGQQYFDKSTSPIQDYVWNGSAWSTVSVSLMELSSLSQLESGTAPSGPFVPLSNDVFTFVNAALQSVLNKSTETSIGLIQEATDAQAVSGANLNPLVPLAVQPKNLAAIFASNPAIGTNLPNTAVFTRLGIKKAASFIGTGTLVAGSQTIINTNIATGDVILLTRTAVNASTAIGELSYTINNGVSFTVTSLNVTTATKLSGDMSSYAYFIIRPS